MLIALPNQDGSFTVTLFLPKEGAVSFQSLENPKNVRPFFEEYFPDAIRLIPNLEEDFADNPTGRLGTVRCAPWYYSEKALILGDASHAIVPFHGQGMNAGFEDCSELNRLLDKHDDDWSQVLPEFDRIRRPNAEAIASFHATLFDGHVSVAALRRSVRPGAKAKSNFESVGRKPGLGR